MRRLAVLFVVLVAVALVAAFAGILLAGRHRRLAGPTILVWRVDRPILEQASEPLLFGGASADSMTVLYPAFRAARADRNVKGIAVYIQSAELGLAKAQELRRQLAALSQAGKFVECYLDSVGEGSNGTLDYYLATACDHIQMSPAGEVNLIGLYAEGTFFKEGLDKLKVDPVYRHVGAFKSYGETYTESHWTPPAAQAINAVLDSSYDQIVAAVATSRRLAARTVRELIDGAPYTATAAVEKKLIDRLGYPDEFRARLSRLAGGRPRWQRLEDYGDAAAGSSGPRIAVLVAQGEIVRGRGRSAPWSDEVEMGSDEMARQLRQAARDASLAAVVLRVDSPGGSALASDLILREVKLLARKKPLVVSMSDLAASGGYYITAGARKIVAEPATLTGSIGVVGGKFVTRRLQEEVLGITHDPLKRGKNADLYSSLTTYTAEQDAGVQARMRHVYDLFVGHVAEARRLPRATVEAVAGGRVWTGADAQRLGLVDELGGLDRAIETRPRSGPPAEGGAGPAGVLPRAPEPVRFPARAARAAPPFLPPPPREEPRAAAGRAPRAASRNRPPGAALLSRKPFP
ncbi:MAG TPA: signal peptide peptidase SppA [Thermoanaerobaculia bacterium]|nr:signal peptide peptidase SppA [Thermoanaerobaculia bacterium]